jgi:pimeloyl-ACP methyl ester carboxylesterase
VAAASWSELQRDGVRIACRDFGGHGPAVLLLHGLAGHAGEWAETAAWLSVDHRVLAFDARGHGRSELDPPDVSPAAQVADAAYLIEQLQLAPAIVLGQSLGGRTALLLAAAHPDLVSALIVADASPSGGGPDAARAVTQLGDSLRRWPLPFPSREAAVVFFAGPSLLAEAWVDGLEHRDGGWWPRFSIEVMERTLSEALSSGYWLEWESICCPTLIIRAGQGLVDPGEAMAMEQRLAQARLVELEGAKHDLHLDQPAQWRDALTVFLSSLPA